MKILSYLKQPRVLFVVAVLVAVVAVLLLRAGGNGSDPASQIIDDPATLDDTHLEIADIDTTSWVEHYIPDACANGVNLVLYRRAVPMLLDMNGRLVHHWPRVRVTGRARLDEQGRLTIIGHDDRLKEYDWDGRLTWSYRPEHRGDFPHHDFIRLASGNYLMPVRSMRTKTDYLVEVDRNAQVVWSWQSREHLERDFPFHDRSSSDPTHFNSVDELPPNQWYDEGDDRFRPGNILVSARNMDCIFVIDKKTGEVVWTFREELDRQHEARMVAGTGVGAGLIVLFNNRMNNRTEYRSSAVQVIHPRLKRVVWEYTAPNFFSSVAGSQVVLPNGSLLISSSHGGRVFEIDLEGNVLWRLVPSYLPMRVERYGNDHCPQLAELDTGPAEPVISKRPGVFIDKELYSFAIVEELDIRTFVGAKRDLLEIHNGCRDLLIPENARIHFHYGLQTKKLFGRSLSGRFRATLQPKGSDEVRLLFEDRVSSDSDELWRASTTQLRDLAHNKVKLCLSVDEIDGFLVSKYRARKSLRWANPNVVIGKPRRNQQRKVSPQIEAHQRKQLEAMGYIE